MKVHSDFQRVEKNLSRFDEFNAYWGFVKFYNRFPDVLKALKMYDDLKSKST